MNTQVYLMLVRKVNPMLQGPAKAAAMLKNFVGGDSLDLPFLKFIRVQSVSHSIGFGGEEKTTQVENGVAKTYTTDTGGSAGDYKQPKSASQWLGGGYEKTHSRWGVTETADYRDFKKHTPIGMAGGVFSAFKNNQFVNVNLPSHNEFKFTKWVDNATPQLAYGCSAQEPYYFAAFFFRRRIGTGVKGIRLPFLTITLRKCLITGWSLNDETEEVTLKYKEMAWATWDQVADINAPTGMSARVWDTDGKSGGEKKEAYIAQFLIAALTAAGGAIADGLSDGMEVEDGPAPPTP